MYRPKTTLEQWRILQAVVDFGGYAQAAKHLNKSQSSLNHAVAKLQTMLDVELLRVVGRKAELTPAGEVMLRRSRFLTENVENLESLAVSINQDWEPEITIAVDLAYPREWLYPVWRDFLPESRQSRLRIVDEVLTGTDKAVTEHKADLVIHLSVPKGYLGEPIGLVDFVLVCHPSHRLTELGPALDPNALAQELQIVIKDTAPQPSENSGWLRSEHRWTVSHFETAIELLSQNIGFCWIPRHRVKQALADGRLRALAVAGSQFKQHTAYLICPNADNKGPGVALLEQLILKHRKIAPPLIDLP